MPDVSAPNCRPTKAGQELPNVAESIPLSGKLINSSLESAGNAPGSVQSAGIEPAQWSQRSEVDTVSQYCTQYCTAVQGTQATTCTLSSASVSQPKCTFEPSLVCSCCLPFLQCNLQMQAEEGCTVYLLLLPMCKEQMHTSPVMAAPLI